MSLFRTVLSAGRWKYGMVFCTARIRINFSVEVLMMKNLMGFMREDFRKALVKAAGDHYEFPDETGTSTETLLKKYIDQDMPVVFWACINMRKEIPGPEWKLLDTGERFCWTSNEHCMLLVGYDEEKYYFNDPYDNNGVVGYPRTLVEKRHAAQHSMALGVLKR